MGLLMFIGVKQAHLKAAVGSIDLFRHPSLKPLLSIVEFINFVVSCLIIEAEKIDEMTLTIRKEIVRREAQRTSQRQEQRELSKDSGTSVHQVLAAHFPDRKETQADNWLLSLLREHLRAAKQIRSLLHGRKSAPSGGSEWDDVNITVSELGVLHAFRKAQQRVRDVMVHVQDKEALSAVSSLSALLVNLSYGLNAAAGELEQCHTALKKNTIMDSAERRIDELVAKDQRNKDASYSALWYNIAVNSPQPSKVAAGMQRHAAPAPDFAAQHPVAAAVADQLAAAHQQQRQQLLDESPRHAGSSHPPSASWPSWPAAPSSRVAGDLPPHLQRQQQHHSSGSVLPWEVGSLMGGRVAAAQEDEFLDQLCD
eukprot:TRINITY_DN10902_c0_g1_i2.p1 TRINITY_DN10902_c0_g1~~TRINITY_DN10902_c0_g1_i2.p1  ORF type:complete len:368 (+),score=105.05 TRINITY_DN10902_c0_g1_i2:334-1437(+)